MRALLGQQQAPQQPVQRQRRLRPTAHVPAGRRRAAVPVQTPRRAHVVAVLASSSPTAQLEQQQQQQQAGGGGGTPAAAVAQQQQQRAPQESNIVPAPMLGMARPQRLEEAEPQSVPIFVHLGGDAVASAHASPEAFRSALKALAGAGVSGVAFDCWWGATEPAARAYEWAPMRAALDAARDAGLRARVAFCFHADEAHPLPAWVVAEGRECPDIFPTDRAGARSSECLSIGVDDVPVLAGRSPLQAYSDLMRAFACEFAPYLGAVVTDADVGLGPRGELRYPATPPDSRWNFPGVGEFQCYDRFMVASLSAAAQQAGQPHWGTSGPHDAGGYCQWPHQTGFFHHQGSWGGEYGRFFLAWYSALLTRHADALLARAAAIFGSSGGGGSGLGGSSSSSGVRLHARLPTIHWWYNQAAHAAELTAGLYNTAARNGYLGFCRVLARHGVGLGLTGGEMRDCEQPSYALASPEALLLQLRATAASQQVPVTLGNLSPRLDGDALAELERKAFAPASYAGIDLRRVDALVFAAGAGGADALLEPGAAWPAFRGWVAGVRARNAAIAAARAPRSARQRAANAAAAAASAAAGGSTRGQPPSEQQQQQQQQPAEQQREVAPVAA